MPTPGPDWVLGAPGGHLEGAQPRRFSGSLVLHGIRAGARCTPGEGGSEGHPSVRSRGPESGRWPRVSSSQHRALPEQVRAGGAVCAMGPPTPRWTPALIRFRTCFHHAFPAPLPTGNPLCLPTCFLPHCEVRTCAAVCSPALPWHVPRPVLSGVGRRLDSRPARSQLWTGAWPAPPPTPFVSPGRVLLPSGWVSLRVGRRPPSTPPLPLTPAPPVGWPVVREGRRAPTKNARARGPAISFPAGAGTSGTHRAPPRQDALGTLIHRNQSGCSPKRKGL